MRKSLLAAAAAMLLAAPAAAQPSAPPRLLIVISIDQLSSDLWDQYRPQFSGGLARLASGTVFRNGYQSHASTETCPGHSTILTGNRPARTGIIANAWVDQSQTRSDKGVYCAEDERVPGSSSTVYTVSPMHLRVPTLGDLLKQRNPASLNVAVGGKDRSAVMMGGRQVDQRWYWDGRTFATDLRSAPVPASVTATRAAVAQAVARAQPGLEPTPFCASKAQVIAIEGGGKPVGDGRLARAGGDSAAFRATPEFDGAVLALSAALVREMRLGADSKPDILSIGLAATDYVGHAYGSGGQEMCLQLSALDRELGDFFARLDGWGMDYAVALTADHGGLDVPERLRMRGVADAARMDAALEPAAMGKAIAEKLKLGGPVLLGSIPGDIYIDGGLRPSDRARARDEALDLYRRHPQVAGAFTRDQLGRVPMPSSSPDKWTLLERLRASFDPERSGDMLVVLKPNITPIADTTRYVATHGSPWDYDRRVPILFWRSGMPGSASEDAVETVDIMPTLAAMIGVPLAPGSVDGECLIRVPGVNCPADAASPQPERGKR